MTLDFSSKVQNLALIFGIDLAQPPTQNKTEKGPRCDNHGMTFLFFFLIFTFFERGSGVLPKGQHSWNISITKEARMDPEVVLDSSAECLFRGIFFCP